MRLTITKRNNSSKSHSKTRKYGETRLTISAWAIGAGMNPQTMEKMFRREGIEVEPRKIYGIRDFVTALCGDERAAKVRNLELDARKKEREEKVAAGQLVAWELVEKRVNDFALGLVQAFDAAPNEISREWIEKVLKPAVRQQLQKPQVNGE